MSHNDTRTSYALALYVAVFTAAVLSDLPAWIKAGITTPFLLIIPGWLLFLSLRIHIRDAWATLGLSIGFSVLILMVGGFITNLVFSYLEIAEPLSLIPMLCMVNITSVTLLITVSLQRRIPPISLRIQNVSASALCFFFIPLVLPLLAISGAIRLNNGGTNTLTMMMLGGIVVCIVAILCVRKRIGEHVYPYVLFCIALSLLLSTSLRGWYTTGHDNQLEYYVFQLTKNYHHWTIDAYRDAYNACLSITILPTIFADFTSLPDPYIFKIIFQIVFAYSPVIVFLFLKRHVTTIPAFISALYFVSFPTFFNDMPMLNRQEISFLFFFLLLYVLFSRTIPRKQKTLVSAILACGMIISHYATTYIVLAVLTVTYTLSMLLQNRTAQKSTRRFLPFSYRRFISGVLICMLAIGTFLWNVQLTKTSDGLVKTVWETVTTIHLAFGKENKSSDISYSLFFSHVVDDATYINTHIEEDIAYAQRQGITDLYPHETYANYTPEIIPVPTSPLTPPGTLVQSAGIDVFRFNYQLRQIAAKGLQLLVGIGFVGLWIYRRGRRYEIEYVIAGFVSIMFIILMIVLPQLSLRYGLLRLFQQSLVFLSFPVFLGSLIPLRYMFRHLAPYPAVMVLIVFFLTVQGFFSAAMGGYYPHLNLYNAGIYYDAYYLHAEEVYATQWLHRQPGADKTVQTDGLGENKLFSLKPAHVVGTIFPAAIGRSSYVFLGNTNTRGETIVSVDRQVAVRYPVSFFDENKNLLYNNGSSRIYK